MINHKSIGCLIEEIVHLKGDVKMSDLSLKDQLALVDHALYDLRFDDYETYLDGIDIPGLIKSMFNGIFDDHLKEEIQDRLIIYFEPLIDQLLEKEYQNQYLDNEINRDLGFLFN